MSNDKVLVSEVGPRDGLQSVSQILPTIEKLAWIRAEADAGVSEIEVGSFVSPKLLPQLADTAAVVSGALEIADLTVAVLIPNLHGAENAIRCGAHKMSIPFSVSRLHSRKNLRRDHDEMFTEIRRISARVKDTETPQRPKFEAGLSTAFGCTMEGPVSEDLVVRSAATLMECGINELSLSDTTGYANPTQVRRLVRRVQNEVGRENLGAVHLHNTRGLGLANALAAIEEGIQTIDSSLGGIGGCPFAPGASGNIVTEDLVFMLESMGIDTGIDLEKLLNVREILRSALPDEPMYGFVPDSGLPIGYVPAREQSATP